MQLELMTWLEVEAYLAAHSGVILPVGSIEQHGPMGLIGTDALCAELIAKLVGEKLTVPVAPAVRYAPAEFNMAFPGTLSISVETYAKTIFEVLTGLASHGFEKIYILNGHGANLAPIRSVVHEVRADIRLKSWWDFPAVQELRQNLYGQWEGMHATPSEIAITQAAHRVVEAGIATDPPRQLTPEYIEAHSGDKHGPPLEHRRDFPDGRVGSHSALASPEHGQQLIEAAVGGVFADYSEFVGMGNSSFSNI